MHRGKKSFDWAYMFQAESTDTPRVSRLVGACKTFIWLGVSILMGLGVSQLT